MDASRTHNHRSANRAPTDAPQSRPHRLSFLQRLHRSRRAENLEDSQGSFLSSRSTDAPPQSHSSPTHTLHAINESQNAQRGGKIQWLKNARETTLKGLKLVLDIAEKASDVIPIHTVNAVIGGLQVLLERQEVWHIIYLSVYFFWLTDHATD